jgi:acetolactate synthase I/III small subunit
MQHTFVLHVADRPGVLNRVSSLVRRRGYNIESLTVGHTENGGTSRMTLVVEASAEAAPRIEANIYKLVHIRRVENVTAISAVCRELAMVKVSTTAESRSHVMQLVDVFRARVIDVAPDSLIIEITGTEDKIDGLLEMLRPFGVIEMARTGRLAMARGLAAQKLAGVSTGQTRTDTDESISCSV